MRHFYLPNNPFGRNFARYTRKERCLEAPDLMPDDGTKKIFLYTFGDSRGESPEMVRFLKYLQNPSNTAGDTLLEEISRAVQYEKQSSQAKEAYRMYSLWYSDTYAKGMKEGEAKGEARHSIRLAMRKLLENRYASEVAEDLYLDTDEIRSIKEAMEALHITCVDEETATCVCAGLDTAHQVQNPAAYS